MPNRAVLAAVVAAVVFAEVWTGPAAEGQSRQPVVGGATCPPMAGMPTVPPWAAGMTPPPNLPSVDSAEVQRMIQEGYAAAGRAIPGQSPAPRGSVDPCAAPRGSPPPGAPVGGDSMAARIYAAAMLLLGKSTAWKGTQCDSFANGDHLGNCACAAAVTWILKQAGYSGAGSYNVDTLMADLLAHGGSVVRPPAQPMAGDIVIAGGEHVGICTQAGCTSIISNSSSHSTFSWQSGANFDGYYGNAPIIIIHVGGP